MHPDQWIIEVMITYMSALNHMVVLVQWWLAPGWRIEAPSQMDYLIYNSIEFVLHAFWKITCIGHETWEAEPICEKSHDRRHHPRVLYGKCLWSKLSTIISVATYSNTYLAQWSCLSGMTKILILIFPQCQDWWMMVSLKRFLLRIWHNSVIVVTHISIFL
jgi:hypothetical protein